MSFRGKSEDIVIILGSWTLIIQPIFLVVEGFSIYIRNLPFAVTDDQLETEFKKFGPIKQGGIQVRNNRVCHRNTLLTIWNTSHIYCPRSSTCLSSNMDTVLGLLSLRLPVQWTMRSRYIHSPLLNLSRSSQPIFSYKILQYNLEL